MFKWKQRAWTDNAAPRRHWLLNENLTVKLLIPPHEVLVRDTLELPKIRQTIVMV